MAELPSRRVTARGDFGFADFLWRLAAAMVLVASTYNPSRYSYFHWLKGAMAGRMLGPEHFVAGVCLLIGWVILFLAARRSIGTLGFVLAGALLGGIVWYLIDLGVLVLGSASALTWVILVCLAVLLAVGLSWSHVWRRMTGQLEVDED
jgi:hypothetical protein